jgi:hypothetical protein
VILVGGSRSPIGMTGFMLNFILNQIEKLAKDRDLAREIGGMGAKLPGSTPVGPNPP